MTDSKLLPQTQITDHFAVVNGKSYRVLRAYQARAIPGNDYQEDYVFLALAGQVRLQPGDLGEHWLVARAGAVYLAYYARVFSYHLLSDQDAPPVSDDWPRVKATNGLVFVGPTSEAAVEVARLTLGQYRPQLTASQIEAAIRRCDRIDDRMGSDVQALHYRI